MKSHSFQEYVNSKNNIPAPVVKTVADIVDPATSPNKPKNGQNYKCSDGKPKKAAEKGFAHMGDQKLKYTPDIKNPDGKAPAKIPTAEAIQQAANIVKNMSNHPVLIEQVVRQMNQQGLLGILVAEIFEHKNAATHLAAMLAHENYGPKMCRKISNAINEEVAKPFSGQLAGEEEEEDEDGSMEDPNDSEDGSDLDVGMEDDNPNMDPNMMGDPSQMDPSMGGDPNMIGDPSQMDPSMGGDPNMMGDPSQIGDPTMMGDPSQMGIDPNINPMMQQPQPPMALTMKKFQRAMMRAYQRAMMRKD